VRGLKKNAARSCFGLALAWAWVCLAAEPTYAAEARVLVLESQAPSSGLVSALQIQLSGLAAPERLAVPAAVSAAESIERGSRLVRERGALAAVWVERTHAPGPVVLYVVGEREGRALVEVIRVPGDRGPELDRTIALKVREFVGAMQRGQAARPEAAQLLQPPPAPGPQPSAALLAEPELEAPPEAARNGEDAAAPAPSTPTWTTLAAVGARLGSQPEVGLGRWGLGVLAGPALELNGLRFAALLAFDVFPSVEVERDGNLVRYWEWAFGAVLHAQAQVGTLWLGARAGTQLVGLDAYGLTSGAREGNSEETAWTLLTGIDAEIPLTLHVSLAASLQLQALAKRLYLDVNRVSLVDLGRVRARIGLDLLARF
jgi:hypothetical protein